MCIMLFCMNGFCGILLSLIKYFINLECHIIQDYSSQSVSLSVIQITTGNSLNNCFKLFRVFQKVIITFSQKRINFNDNDENIM